MVYQVAYLSNILIFLIAAVGTLSLFRILKISSVVGYLIAGMLIGPYMLRIVPDPSATHFLGELGVLALLFTLGLDLPLQRLRSMESHVFKLAIPQVVLTTLCFTFLGLWWGLPKEAALLVGATASLSSTAVVLQLLNDKRELATRFGRVSFAVLLFQDLVVVLLLILVASLQHEGTNVFVELGYATLKAVIALSIIIGLGRFVFRPLYRAVAVKRNMELFLGTTLLVVLGASYIAEIFGLSMELGAFLAGILLAETEYRHQVEADIKPFRGLLLGVFFMSVGMEINTEILISSFFQVVLLLAILLSVKFGIIFLLSRLNKLRNSTSVRSALLLVGGGEFVFIIFSPTVAQHILPPNFIDILFLVVTLSMALTPFLDYLGEKWAIKMQANETELDVANESEEKGSLKNHIIIAGFGRVGQMLGGILDARLIPFVALDVDMCRIAEGREKGWPIFYGDAKNVEVLKGIGAESARAIVVTLNQANASVRTVIAIRRFFPNVPVFVRIRDHKHRDRLLGSGAHLIVPETVDQTLQLASSVLALLDIPKEEVKEIIDSICEEEASD